MTNNSTSYLMAGLATTTVMLLAGCSGAPTTSISSLTPEATVATSDGDRSPVATSSPTPEATEPEIINGNVDPQEYGFVTAGGGVGVVPEYEVYFVGQDDTYGATCAPLATSKFHFPDNTPPSTAGASFVDLYEGLNDEIFLIFPYSYYTWTNGWFEMADGSALPFTVPEPQGYDPITLVFETNEGEPFSAAHGYEQVLRVHLCAEKH